MVPANARTMSAWLCSHLSCTHGIIANPGSQAKRTQKSVKNTGLKQVLEQARVRLDNHLEADLLVSHALQKDRTYLYAYDHIDLNDQQLAAIHQLIKRRQLGEPVAYLLGHKEFYGRSFEVTPAVLIPRPETELIIDQALNLELPPNAKVVDVGTGSGCIGLTLAIERPNWVVCVSDVSADALAICQKNRQTLNPTNVVIQQGALLSPWRDQRFDLIVANLPYIAPNDPHLDDADLGHEPQVALVANDEGFELIFTLIHQAPNHLHSGAYIVLEHGFEQQVAIEKALIEQGFDEVLGLKDLAGQPRLVIARWVVPQ